MPFNPLFWTVLAMLGAAGTAHYLVRRRRRGPDRSAQALSPAAGGEEPEAVEEAILSFPEGRWTARRLETFHSQTRSRLLMTLELEGGRDEEALGFLEELAREVQARTEASVIYLEAHRSGQRPIHLLYAPDGLGWNGQERLRLAVRGPGLETRWR